MVVELIAFCLNICNSAPNDNIYVKNFFEIRYIFFSICCLSFKRCNLAFLYFYSWSALVRKNKHVSDEGVRNSFKNIEITNRLSSRKQIFLNFFFIIWQITRVYLSHVFIKYFSSMFGQVKWKIEFRSFFLAVCSLCLSNGNSHAY